MEAIYQKLLYFKLRFFRYLMTTNTGPRLRISGRQSSYVTDRKSFALSGVGWGLVILSGVCSAYIPHMKCPPPRTQSRTTDEIFFQRFITALKQTALESQQSSEQDVTSHVSDSTLSTLYCCVLSAVSSFRVSRLQLCRYLSSTTNLIRGARWRSG